MFALNLFPIRTDSLNMDFTSGVRTGFWLSAIAAAITLIAGINSIRKGSRITFFQKRQQMVSRGWRLLFLAF